MNYFIHRRRQPNNHPQLVAKVIQDGKHGTIKLKFIPKFLIKWKKNNDNAKTRSPVD